MLDFCVDAEINLTQELFKQLMLDEWDWTDGSTLSNTILHEEAFAYRKVVKKKKK